MPDTERHLPSTYADDGRPVADLITAYREGPSRARAAVAGMDALALCARPIEGKLSSLEVICHVVDCDQFMADRMKRTAAVDRPLLLGANTSAYSGALHFHDRDLGLQLRLLEVTREQMSADLERLDSEAWTREAVHSEVGLVTLRELVLHAVRHLEGHLETIAEKREALGV